MSGKKIMILSLFIAVVILAVIVGVWWRVFFGAPNPPLPAATVSIASSSASASTTITASSSPVVATSSAPAASSTPSSVSSTPIVAGENPPLAEEQLSVDGAVFNVEIASTTIEQTRGLSFRPSLAARAGMLFIFSKGGIQSFWMKDMNFPLDMVWISGNTVAGFAQNVPAPAPGTAVWQLPTYASPQDVDKVLEVNAGTVAKYTIRVGDTVTIIPAQ